VKVPALKLSLPVPDRHQLARSSQNMTRSPRVCHIKLPQTEFQKNTITPREVLKATPRIEEASEENESSSSDSETDSSCSTHSTASLSPVSNRQSLTTPELPMELPQPSENEDESDEEETTYSRMTQLAAEAEQSAKKLSSTLDTALEHGSKLLRYLDQGMGGSEDAREELPRRIQTALHTVNKFTSMLSGAIMEIEKHQSIKLQKRDSPTAVASRRVESFGFAHRRRQPKGYGDEQASRLLARDAVERAVVRACSSEPSALRRPLWEPSPRSARSNDSSRSSLSAGCSRKTISAIARPLRFRNAEVSSNKSASTR